MPVYVPGFGTGPDSSTLPVCSSVPSAFVNSMPLASLPMAAKMMTATKALKEKMVVLQE